MKKILLVLLLFGYCVSTPDETVNEENISKPVICPEHYENIQGDCLIKNEFVLKPLPKKETKLVKVGKLYWQDGDPRYYPDWGEKCFDSTLGTNDYKNYICTKEGIKHYIGFGLNGYEEADNYCKEKGMRLPTEKEWKELIKSKKENLLTFTISDTDGGGKINNSKRENFFWLKTETKESDEGIYNVAGDKPNPYVCNLDFSNTKLSTYKINIGELSRQEEISFEYAFKKKFYKDSRCYDKRDGCSPIASVTSIHGLTNGGVPIGCDYYFMVRCVTDSIK